MPVIDIKELFANFPLHAGKEMTVCGWIRTIRSSNMFGFIELNDGSCFKNLQIVFESGVLENYKDIAAQNAGAGVTVEGVLVLTPDAKQPFEMKAKRITVEGESAPDYKLQKKRHTPEFLRIIAHLRPRTNLYSAIFRIRSVAALAIHRFFGDRNFVYVHTPLITGSDCEGAGEMFTVSTLDMKNPPKDKDGNIDYSCDFFGKPTNLTVSGQLNVEAFALTYGKVYTFGPTFRAEASNTTRHAAEFWMIEPEIAFAELSDDMNLARDMLVFVVRDVLKKCAYELEFLNAFVEQGLIDKLTKLANAAFEAVTYTEAVKILEESGAAFEYPVKWGMDIQTEHERYLAEKKFNCPVFVTDYPKDIKSFYMRQNDDGKTVAAMDLLVPGIGELIGGSQREERYDNLIQALEYFKLNPSDYDWYLELRKYGGVKHAGFGLGFERLIMYLTGASNIRDVIAFPRTYGSAEF